MALLVLLPLALLWLAPWLLRHYHRTVAKNAAAGPPEPGLVPKERQNTVCSGPDPELEAALAAARSGAWLPAAELLDGTGDDWDLRASRANALGEPAAWDDTWLKAWQTERPDDPTAALVEAFGLVDLAWKMRGRLYAQHTTQQQVEGFLSVLTRARTAAVHAVRLAPEDPCARMPELRVGIGLNYSHQDFRTMWAQIEKRAPHHFLAHSTALQYWCAKWHGSQELANRFAAEAAAGAPLGSLLSALPLISWYEHRTSDAKQSEFRAAFMIARVDALLADVAAAPAGHPQLSDARHLLAYFLYQQGRFQESAEQFRLVDGWVGAFPWRYQTDSAEFFVLVRNQAIKKALKRAK